MIPDPTVSGIVSLAALVEIGSLSAAERIIRKRLEFLVHVKAIDLRRIQIKDVRFVLFGELLVTELFTQLVMNLELVKELLPRFL